MALGLAALPLWLTRTLPLVDLPQHLHLISVLHRLHDPTTLYPQVFAARGELTPYLGYYALVDALNWLLPLDVANKVFLTGYIVGLPLALGFLLRSLGRPRWVSLVAIPFAYGDSFSWGFINYCASVPLALLAAGLFVRALVDAPHRRRWAGANGAVLAAVLLFHVQAFAFLAFALPFLLLTTRVPEDAARTKFVDRVRARGWALASVIPGVVLFLVWVVARLGAPAEVEAGAPWHAWGPMLSPENLAFKPFSKNGSELLGVLANALRDGSDRWPVYAAFGLGVAGWMGLVGGRAPSREGVVERWRLVGLGAIALVLFFTLPFDIRGYIYYLNTRFAHLAVPLLLAAVAPVAAPRRAFLMWGGLGLGALVAGVYGKAYRAFDEEAAPLERMAQAAGARPRVMALMFNPSSRVVTHPVFLHAGAVLAREGGGFTNFSFASTPHSPIQWAHAAPVTFPSEWQPDGFRYDSMGPAYDTFLLRGKSPEAVFRDVLGTELRVTAQAADFFLLQRP